MRRSRHTLRLRGSGDNDLLTYSEKLPLCSYLRRSRSFPLEMVYGIGEGYEDISAGGSPMTPEPIGLDDRMQRSYDQGGMPTASETGCCRVAPSTVCDGRGLFADGPLAQGTVVARILAPLWLPTRGAIAFAARGHLPKDSFVRSELGRACVDLAWVLPPQPPPWYFLNHAHASVANLNMRVVQTSTQHGVLWYANRDISAGTELRYNYGSVPSAWNVDAVGLGQQHYLEISAHNVQIRPRARKRRLLT